MHLAGELINSLIVPLSIRDSAARAREVFMEFMVKHYPVVEEGHFYGLLRYATVREMPADATIETVKSELIPLSISSDAHILDAMKIMHESGTDLVAAVSPHQGHYLGAITMADIFSRICEMNMVRDPGTIIVIEMAIRDYDLSRIARIIEECDARISGVFFHSHPDSSKIFLTIKINLENPSPVLNAFSRHGIDVVSHFTRSPDYYDTIRRNYEFLLKFLDME